MVWVLCGIGIAFLVLVLRRVSRQSTGLDTGNKGKRQPPTASEFRNAGVDCRICARCTKQIKKMNYVFMLQGIPTVYCPSCWSKATSPMQPDEKLQAWWEQLTSLYERRDSLLC
jgi:hypothetical protein